MQPIVPIRGEITDRHGTVLAQNIPVYTLEAQLDKVMSIDKLITDLKSIVTLTTHDIATFKKSIAHHRRYETIPIKFKLSEKEVAKFAVNQAFFPGISINAEMMRYYPYGAVTAHILGYVGRMNGKEAADLDPNNYSGTHFVGKVGLEKHYEAMLHGKVGYRHYETDATGHLLRTLKMLPSEEGERLQLSVDLPLQQATQRALSGLRAAAIAIEPKTGEVLAMASAPSYNPNQFVQGMGQIAFRTLANSPAQPLYNRALRGQYPLASTIKPFLALAALDGNLIQARTKIFDPGWFQLPGTKHRYRDWRRGGHGWIDLEHAIIASCDTYFYYLSTVIGIKVIDDILFQFGFGQSTQIDMGEELTGLVPSPQWKAQVKKHSWYKGDTLISGIGQGFMLTTPLQLASAVAKLANRGKQFRPHLVKGHRHGEITYQVTPIEEYPISLKQSSSWKMVIHAMEKVITDPHGTGFRFGHPTYRVAAKTGTAQVYSIKQQRQFESEEDVPTYLRDHSLFIAFAPVENPSIAVAVVVENNNLAANIARKMLDNYLMRSSHDRKA